MTHGLITTAAIDYLLALIVAICWGILFGTPRKVLWVAGVLGGLGHMMRFFLLGAGCGLVLSTLLASLAVGLVGIVFAHKVDHPPVVFTMPACITMIPGLYAYRTMLGGIKIVDESVIAQGNPRILLETAHNATLTFSLLAMLAMGISVSVLFFRKRSVRDIDLNWKRRRL